jgi:predicted protein tyrosine phosphatase
MPYTFIDFVSQSDLHYMDGRDDTIVISIRNPNTEPARVAAAFKDKLFLAFDNISRPEPGRVRFSEEMAAEILAFVAKYDGVASRIIVNCMAGETRSAGVAYFLSEKYAVPLTRESEFVSDYVWFLLDHVDSMAQELQQNVVPAAAPALSHA